MRYLIILAGMLLLSSCEGFFGEKTDLEFIDKPIYVGREVAYVPIQPVLDQFVLPTQVLAGWDQLMYVVDQGTSEIISFDLSGRELSRLSIPGLVSITQDRSLDILAIGSIDSVSSTGNPLTLACVYRINQKQGINLSLDNSTVTPVIVHPYYKGLNSATIDDQVVEFKGISALSNYTYYLTRTGPNNNPIQLGGPDDAVLYVSPDIDGNIDQSISPIAVQTSAGFELDYFTKPQAITSLAQPPQNAIITDSRDFIWTSINSDLAIKTQYIQYQETTDGGVYSLKEMASSDTSKADGFLYEPNKFTQPLGVTYAGDGTNYIFVVDSEKDSLYQFSNEGYEGVTPPVFSTETKQIKVSFGGTGISLNQFNNPTGVAYLNEILYVADAGNSRVLRFKLTTDFD